MSYLSITTSISTVAHTTTRVSRPIAPTPMLSPTPTVQPTPVIQPTPVVVESAPTEPSNYPMVAAPPATASIVAATWDLQLGG